MPLCACRQLITHVFHSVMLVCVICAVVAVDCIVVFWQCLALIRPLTSADSGHGDHVVEETAFNSTYSCPRLRSAFL